MDKQTDTLELERLIFLSFQELVLAWIVQRRKAGQRPVMFTLEDYQAGWGAMRGAASPSSPPENVQREQLAMSPHIHEFEEYQPFFFVRSRSRERLLRIDLSNVVDSVVSEEIDE